jgi:transcriptional regulator with GAF, ATPase, and Fis domain
VRARADGNGAAAPPAAPPTAPSPFKRQHARSLADAERIAILAALRTTEGRISGSGGAAERLQLKPTTLHAKMKKLGIRRGDALRLSDATAADG